MNSEIPLDKQPLYKFTKLILTTLFGVIIFLFGILIPAPISQVLYVVQALLLALSSIIVGKGGATYASLINGLLVTFWMPSYPPFNLIFSLIFGLATDGFIYAFKVKEGVKVKTWHSVGAITLSAGLTGLVSTYVTVILGLVPMALIIYVIIVLAGILNGALAGYLTAIVWNKYLIHYFEIP